jgi:hypothetical protein
MPDKHPDGPKFVVPQEAEPPRPEVRLAQHVVAAMRSELPRQQAQSVARAIRRIGVDEGIQLASGAPSDLQPEDGSKYLVMVPDDDDAPVVVYRLLDKLEGGGYLVTGLADRRAYDAYTGSRKPSFFETPTGRAVQSAAWTAFVTAVGIAIGRTLSGGSSGGSQALP